MAGMTKKVRAHFDGHVFVPDEPVDVPTGTALQLHIRTVDEPEESAAGRTLADLADWLERLPPIDRGALPADGAAQIDHYLYGHRRSH